MKMRTRSTIPLKIFSQLNVYKVWEKSLNYKKIIIYKCKKNFISDDKTKYKILRIGLSVFLLLKFQKYLIHYINGNVKQQWLFTIPLKYLTPNFSTYAIILHEWLTGIMQSILLFIFTFTSMCNNGIVSQDMERAIFKVSVLRCHWASRKLNCYYKLLSFSFFSLCCIHYSYKCIVMVVPGRFIVIICRNKPL